MPPTPSPTPVLPGAPSWLTPALTGPLIGASVACLALFFTICSFWWLNARRGKVRGFPPSSFAASFGSRRLVLILPLVLLNDGAAPVVVTDLRIRLAKPDKQLQQERLAAKAAGTPPPEPPELVLRLRGTHAALPESLSPPRLPTIFAVGGRKTESLILEFGLKDPAFVPLGGAYRATVEGRLERQRGFSRRAWKKVVAFDLRADRVGADGRYAAASNDPDWKP